MTNAPTQASHKVCVATTRGRYAPAARAAPCTAAGRWVAPLALVSSSSSSSPSRAGRCKMRA
eukprot:9418938-Lingulodinium_polyedra.AAC.1